MADERFTLGGVTFINPASTLADAKGQRIAEIKDAARERILAICPEWKQTNLLARGTELLLRVQLGGAPPTEAEQAEIVAGQAIWTEIKAIRTASDVAEAAVNAATTPAAVWGVSF